jgi:hypothetical protein
MRIYYFVEVLFPQRGRLSSRRGEGCLPAGGKVVFPQGGRSSLQNENNKIVLKWKD